MIGCRECPSGREVCRLCARRLCTEHTPFGGDACAACELAYLESRDGLRLELWVLIGCALPWIVLAALHGHLPTESMPAGGFRGVSTGSPLIDLALMTTVASVLLGATARGLRVWFHRRSFLRPVRT